MCKSFGNYHISNFRKMTASVISTVMLVVLLFSAFYIATEEEHNCTGEDCPICACMEQCVNNLRQMGDGAVSQVLSALFCIFFLLSLSSQETNLSCVTPVTQKVRLNN